MRRGRIIAILDTLDEAIKSSLDAGKDPVVPARAFDDTGTNPYQLALHLGAYIRYDQSRRRYTFKQGE